MKIKDRLSEVRYLQEIRPISLNQKNLALLLFLCMFLSMMLFLSTPGFTATPSPPQNLRIVSLIGGVTLAWDANTEPDLAGYRIYWGTTPGHPYANAIDVGNVTSFTLSGLAPGTYYVALTAYDFNGSESGFSSQVTIHVEGISRALPFLHLLLSD